MRPMQLSLFFVTIASMIGCSKTTKGNAPAHQKGTTKVSYGPMLKRDSVSEHQTNAPAGFVSVPVTAIPTSDAMKGTGMYSDQYPSSENLDGLDAFASQIQEYGGAYKLWLGPKGWTGSSAAGADGNTSIRLYPMGGSDSSGPHINYTLIPACEGCMLSSAAPYFHQARESWNQQFNQDGSMPIQAPSGLKVDSLSPTLVSFSVPDSAGLLTCGVVYYDSTKSSDVPFAEAKFVLPQADSALAHFLSRSFVTREGLK